MLTPPEGRARSEWAGGVLQRPAVGKGAHSVTGAAA